MNLRKVYAGLAVLILISGLALTLIQKRGNKKSNSVVQTVEQLCYVKNEKTKSGLEEIVAVKVLKEGDVVIGEIKNIPAEKDSKTGPLEAMVVSVDIATRENMTNGWWNTFGEGMSAKEQLVMGFDKDHVRIAFGEMKDRGDGVYMYKNTRKLSWQTAARVDCAMYDGLFPPEPEIE